MLWSTASSTTVILSFVPYPVAFLKNYNVSKIPWPAESIVHLSSPILLLFLDLYIGSPADIEYVSKQHLLFTIFYTLVSPILQSSFDTLHLPSQHKAPQPWQPVPSCPSVNKSKVHFQKLPQVPYGPLLCNSLPHEVRSATTVSCFRQRLKTSITFSTRQVCSLDHKLFPAKEYGIVGIWSGFVAPYNLFSRK